MIGRRVVYWLALVGSMAFFWAYREWLSGFVLLSLLCLPWFSLLVSLPAMLTSRAAVDCAGVVSVGEDEELNWQTGSFLPMPGVKGRLLVKNTLTGEKRKFSAGDWLPTDHCGMLEITLHKPRVCDYLGLFALPIRKREGETVLVRPVAIATPNPPDMTRYQVSAWKPKAGGGFSENHELRLYRPGDNLRQVHWKLSAKTGNLIVREPMEALQNRMLLTLELRGTPEELDRKLGRLLWMSRYLLQCELPHRIQSLTGQGMVAWSVASEEDVLRAVDGLLRQSPAAAEEEPDYMRAAWRYHIGGDDHAG